MAAIVIAASPGAHLLNGPLLQEYVAVGVGGAYLVSVVLNRGRRLPTIRIFYLTTWTEQHLYTEWYLVPAQSPHNLPVPPHFLTL